MADEQSLTESEVTTTAPLIQLEIEADATLGYASIQNSIPVVRVLRITNASTESLENLDVLVICSPRFAQGTKLKFERLAPGETRTISPLDLRPEHDYLADLQESVKATIQVRAALGGKQQVGHLSQEMEILAYDQWASLRGLPELLAAFCMPNNPSVDILIGNASKLLRSQFPDLSMNGYQSKNREVVWKQVSAIYSAVCAEALQYAEPPASFGSNGQKIRTPDRILEGRVATCLDLAMLFAACLEQAGLRPVILLKEGHAWVGVWLHPVSFPNPIMDDVQAIRKRVASGEFLVFETTGVAQHHTQRPSLRVALELGESHLNEEQAFSFAVDIQRARELQIKPLPSKHVLIQRGVDAQQEAPSPIEPLPQLPPLDADSIPAIEISAAESAKGRLDSWKAKLLDLTLRNRLLNFKPTKSTLRFTAPDLATVEDALADGGEFRVRAARRIMEGADARDAQVHAARSGKAAAEDMAREALANGDLLVDVAGQFDNQRAMEEALQNSLLAIYSGARTGLEEGGANTLFVALGILRWTDTEKSDTPHSAPILLVPVTLERSSVRSGFKLTRHDDETIVNPTLIELLKGQELRIGGIDPLPMDSKGVDVPKVLQLFRLAVRELPKWEVLEEAHLGLFSFTKFLMWKDLQDRAEDLKTNRVVKHLIDRPGEAFPAEQASQKLEALDEHFAPQDLLAPLLSDSSQLKAICAVDLGRDLVLKGPPGTGKSQTITNMIAHLLGKGKSVLFVSEKMAALEVVNRRLTAIGLAPFCLELHSSKAKKSEVLKQLGNSLDLADSAPSSEWLLEAERLAQLRLDLNGFVAAIHKEHPNGLTVYIATGTCIENSGRDPALMPWSDPLVHDRKALMGLREISKRMAATCSALTRVSGHPLKAIGKGEWSPSWQDNLLAAAESCEEAITAFQEASSHVLTSLRLPARGLSLESYDAVDRLADALLGAPNVPAGVVRRAQDPAARARLQALTRHGIARNDAWLALGVGWSTQASKLNATDLQGRWLAAVGAWWPKSWFAKRSVLAMLATFRSDAKPIPEPSIGAFIEALSKVNEEDRDLESLRLDAESLLEDTFHGVDTDWNAVSKNEQWLGHLNDAVAGVIARAQDQAHELSASIESLIAPGNAAFRPGNVLGNALLAFRDTWRVTKLSLTALESLAMVSQPLSGSSDAGGALERILGEIAAWKSNYRALQPWCLWRGVRDTAISAGLKGIVSAAENGVIQFGEIEQYFEFSYQAWWLKKTVDADPLLRGFSSSDHERKIRDFRKLDAQFQKLTERQVIANLRSRLPSSALDIPVADSELGRLRREMQKQRKQLPLRQLFQGMPTLLQKLKPCLLMSPLSVAQYLEASHAQFDVVIFDEASQIPVWEAVGAIARGKQLVVVGDPKQLPPTNFFGRATDDESNTSEDQVDDLESILDECIGAQLNTLSLQWHYRSKHESLITFSNATYYDSELITFPSPVTQDTAVRFNYVGGIYDRGNSRTNRKEADAVVDAIQQHFMTPKSGLQSVGVVTFNQPQQALIEKLLDARRREVPDLDRAIAAAPGEPLFIKNLENVQGDERDVILFSTTFGPDIAGKITMTFGPLNLDGGQRRLNVAVSRAREGIVIFGSLLPEHIDLSRVRAAGVRDLKNYLDFAIRGPRALVESRSFTGLEPDSPFEVAVIRKLRDKGWDVHPQVGCSGYRLDIGVVDPRAPGRYLLGVECDGRAYHSGKTARDRDRLRQHVLEGLGWRIHRIWSTDWWIDPDREISKLTAVLDEILVKEPEDAEEPEADPVIPLSVDDTVEAPTAPVSPVAGPPAFKQAVLDSGNPDLFYGGESSKQITGQIVHLVTIEGPLPETQLFRRVARAWGLERTGSRIVERLRAHVPGDLKTTLEGDTKFYWPPGGDPETWDTFRIADAALEESKRNIADVASQEIAAIVVFVLNQAGATSLEDLTKAVCRLLGMARVTADADSRAREVVTAMVEAQQLIEAGQYVRVQR